MELVEWVSFVLIMFKVVFLGAFGVVETANLYFSDNCHLYFFDYEIWIWLILKYVYLCDNDNQTTSRWNGCLLFK